MARTGTRTPFTPKTFLENLAQNAIALGMQGGAVRLQVDVPLDKFEALIAYVWTYGNPIHPEDRA